MFFKNLTKCILLIPMLSIGFNAYAESCNNISPYKSGCDKVAHNQRATCERRAYEQCKWRQNKGIDEIIVTPKFQSRHDIRVKLKPYKQKNQFTLTSGVRSWSNYYWNKLKKHIFKNDDNIINNCRQSASTVQTFRERNVQRMYGSGKLNNQKDFKVVVQWKNGIGTYEYMDTAHNSLRAVEKDFKWDEGKGCKNIKNQPTPKKNDRVATIPNSYSSGLRKNSYKRNYNYRKSYISSKYGRYRIQRSNVNKYRHR
jgi:hypothetical protein